MKSDQESQDRRLVDQSIRDAYEGGQIYKTETINLTPSEDAQSYVERLLADKIATIRKHARPGLLVDLCCGNGEHLFALETLNLESVGIDFSRPFVQRAREEAAKRNLTKMRFEVGDARQMPLADSSVTTLYSLSSLYIIPGVEDVLRDISRVLAPGGRCILDLANSRSLNSICVRAYTELPPSFHMPVAEMKRLCALNGLHIVVHRRFQILPLWADKPRWLSPLLHPIWKSILSRRVGGRMLDEWISSMPVLRAFAFRHLLVCEKRSS